MEANIMANYLLSVCELFEIPVHFLLVYALKVIKSIAKKICKNKIINISSIEINKTIPITFH